VKRLALAALLAGCSLTLDFEDECAADDDCASGLTCVGGLCVEGGGGGEVTSADCPTLYGVPAARARDPDVMLVGTLLPTTGQLAEYGPPMERAVYLAVDEINQSGGINGKMLAVVSCDDGSTDEVKSVAAAKHLVDTVGVKAIIGSAASSLTIKVFNDVAKPAGVLMISPASTSPAITDLPDGNLLWRTVPSDAIQGAAIAAHVVASGHAKVAVVNRDDTYGNGLQEAIRKGLCTPDRQCEANYLPQLYDPDQFQDPQSRALVRLQDFAPDIVVLVGFLDDGINFLKLASTAGLKRFILTDGMKDGRIVDDVPDRDLVGAIVGTAPADPQGENYRAFTFRFRSKWDAEPGAYTANAYDAAYALGYALGSLDGRIAITGGSIAGQLRRLSTGRTKINVGGTDFNRAVQALRRGGDATIDLEGASGSLNFDGARGEAPANIEGWRLDLEAKRVKSIGLLYLADGTYVAPEAEAAPDAATPDAGPADAAAPADQ
jgi:ABC-type branched-subunit amino acid transport system substrate-binding protein